MSKSNDQRLDEITGEIHENESEFGFREGESVGTFLQKVDEWIRGEIIAYKVVPKKARVILLTKSERGYRLNRIFPIGGSWQISVDAEGAAEQVLVSMVEN